MNAYGRWTWEYRPVDISLRIFSSNVYGPSLSLLLLLFWSRTVCTTVYHFTNWLVGLEVNSIWMVGKKKKKSTASRFSRSSTTFRLIRSSMSKLGVPRQRSTQWKEVKEKENNKNDFLKDIASGRDNWQVNRKRACHHNRNQSASLNSLVAMRVCVCVKRAGSLRYPEFSPPPPYSSSLSSVYSFSFPLFLLFSLLFCPLDARRICDTLK